MGALRLCVWVKVLVGRGGAGRGAGGRRRGRRTGRGVTHTSNCRGVSGAWNLSPLQAAEGACAAAPRDSTPRPGKGAALTRLPARLWACSALDRFFLRKTRNSGSAAPDREGGRAVSGAAGCGAVSALPSRAAWLQGSLAASRPAGWGWALWSRRARGRPVGSWGTSSHCTARPAEAGPRARTGWRAAAVSAGTL